MNRDDICKIHVLWGKGGCCVNLIVRHEQLAMHLYDRYLLWKMLTPSWWFKKMRLADFTLIVLLRRIKQEWSSNITSSITSRPQNPLLNFLVSAHLLKSSEFVSKLLKSTASVFSNQDEKCSYFNSWFKFIYFLWDSSNCDFTYLFIPSLIISRLSCYIRNAKLSNMFQERRVWRPPSWKDQQTLGGKKKTNFFIKISKIKTRRCFWQCFSIHLVIYYFKECWLNLYWFL